MTNWKLANLILVLLLCAGCAASLPRNTEWASVQGGPELVWPQPPAPARIRYLRSVDDSLALVRNDRTSRFLTWLAGDTRTLVPLLMPYAVVADGFGRLWVTDSETRVVHSFDLVRQSVDYWSQLDGINLMSPLGLAIDLQLKHIYLSDSILKKVFVTDFSGKLLGTLEPPGGFQRPTGMATDVSGNLFVADTQRGEILVFSRDGKFQKSFGSRLNPEGKFSFPTGLAIDPQGRVVVNDSMNFRIEILPFDDRPALAIGGLGDVPGSFARPRGVAVDSDGHIYVSDAAFGNVQIFDDQGQLLLYFGKWGDQAGEMSLPAGLFIDQSDRIYLVDTYNHRVQIFQYLKSQ